MSGNEHLYLIPLQKKQRYFSNATAWYLGQGDKNQLPRKMKEPVPEDELE